MEHPLLVLHFLLTTSRKKSVLFFYAKLIQVFIREMAWVLVRPRK